MENVQIVQTLTLLMTSHLLGDFVFQTEWMVKRKQNPGVLALHAATVTVVTLVVVGTLSPVVLAVTFATHLGIDLCKGAWVRSQGDGWRVFAIDQAAHVAVVAALALMVPRAFGEGFWPGLLGEKASRVFVTLLAVAGGLTLSLPAGGHLIALMTRAFVEQLPSAFREGLPLGGRYIGYLERGFVLMLVLADKTDAIGFVIAAKSVLRFSEVKEAGDRKIAEYIIIGTFLSFGWGLAVALGLQWVLELVG